MKSNVVLSLFSGMDLLGMGFEAEGFCVVSAGDLIWGRDVADFTPARHIFEGVIAGTPCQDFSKARRNPPTGRGVVALSQFARCVTAATPYWWLLENVPGVPAVEIPGYKVQRFNLDAKECGCQQRRLRRFQFGSRDGAALVITRVVPPQNLSRCCLASEWQRKNRRTFADFCRDMGLSKCPDLPGLSQALRYRLVGNGVPVPMARVIAGAIRARRVTPKVRLCACECGRTISGRRVTATPACRKRMQRARDALRVTMPGKFAKAVSLEL